MCVHRPVDVSHCEVNYPICSDLALLHAQMMYIKPINGGGEYCMSNIHLAQVPENNMTITGQLCTRLHLTHP